MKYCIYLKGVFDGSLKSTTFNTEILVVAVETVGFMILYIFNILQIVKRKKKNFRHWIVEFVSEPVRSFVSHVEIQR